MKYIFGSKSQGRSGIIWVVALGWHAGVKLQPGKTCHAGLLILIYTSLWGFGTVLHVFFWWWILQFLTSWTNIYFLLPAYIAMLGNALRAQLGEFALQLFESRRQNITAWHWQMLEMEKHTVSTWPLARPCPAEAPVPPHQWVTLLQPWWQREVLGKLLKETNGRALLVLGTAGLLPSPACPKASHLFSCVRRDDRWAEGTLWRALKVETSSLNQYFQED